VEIEAHIIFFKILKQMEKFIAKKDTIQKGHMDLGKTNPNQPKPQSLPRRVLGILIYLKTI
jgi:hypothetical protein